MGCSADRQEAWNESTVMARGQNIGDIIRDALNSLNSVGTGPSRKVKRKYKSGLPMVRDDARQPRPAGAGRTGSGPYSNYDPTTGPKKKKKGRTVSPNAANKGTKIMVPNPKGDRRAFARYRTVYGSGKTGGMR